MKRPSRSIKLSVCKSGLSGLISGYHLFNWSSYSNPASLIIFFNSTSQSREQAGFMKYIQNTNCKHTNILKKQTKVHPVSDFLKGFRLILFDYFIFKFNSYIISSVISPFFKFSTFLRFSSNYTDFGDTLILFCAFSWSTI